jgi:hypothetical protein
MTIEKTAKMNRPAKRPTRDLLIDIVETEVVPKANRVVRASTRRCRGLALACDVPETLVRRPRLPSRLACSGAYFFTRTRTTHVFSDVRFSQ